MELMCDRTTVNQKSFGGRVKRGEGKEEASALPF